MLNRILVGGMAVVISLFFLAGCSEAEQPTTISSVSTESEQVGSDSSSQSIASIPQKPEPLPAPSKSNQPLLTDGQINPINYNGYIVAETGIYADLPINGRRQFTYFNLESYEHTIVLDGDGRLTPEDVSWAAMVPGGNEMVVHTTSNGELGQRDEKLSLYDAEGNFVREIFATHHDNIDVLGISTDKIYVYKEFISYPFIHKYSSIDIATGEETIFLNEEIQPPYHYLDQRYNEREHHAYGENIYITRIGVPESYDNSADVPLESRLYVTEVNVNSGETKEIYSELFLTEDKPSQSYHNENMVFVNGNDNYKVFNLVKEQEVDLSRVNINEEYLSRFYPSIIINGWLSGYVETEKSHPSAFVANINLETGDLVIAEFMQYNWYQPVTVTADLGDSLLVNISTKDIVTNNDGTLDTLAIHAVINKDDYFSNTENYHLFNTDSLTEYIEQPN